MRDLTKRSLIRQERNIILPGISTELATVADAVDHIDHVIQIAGIDYVGIGTDFDGGGGIEDVMDVSQMKNLTIEMLRRGYTKKELEKIWGGNVMRVLKRLKNCLRK